MSATTDQRRRATSSPTDTLLAAGERWPRARTLDLSVRCRGAVMKDWGPRCNERWGPDAVARVLERAELSASEVPAAPADDRQIDASAQILVTEAIADIWLEGDMRRLRDVLVEDAIAAVGGAARMGLRALGPGAILRRSGDLYARLYDEGSCSAKVRRGHAELEFRGSSLFEHPTWQALQICSCEVLVQVCHRRVTAAKVQAAPSRFHIGLHWK